MIGYFFEFEYLKTKGALFFNKNSISFNCYEW